MLQTHNKHTIRSVQQMEKVNREKGESGVKQWMKANLERVGAPQPDRYASGGD